MSAPPVSTKDLQAAVDALAQYSTKSAAAKVLGQPLETFKNRLKIAARSGIKASTKVEVSAMADARRQIERLEKDLKAAGKEQADHAAIKRLIHNSVTELDTLKLPAWAVKPQAANCPGVPTLQLSDFHWGERVFSKQVNNVNEFNITIARERLTQTIETAIHLCRLLDSDMRYPGIVVPLGGDMVSGAIHEELRASNEIPTMPVVLDLVDNLAPAILTLADTFGKVFLPCVSGNHGRDTMKIYSKGRNHTSFDWLLYQFLARALGSDKRITFYIPEGSDASYRIFNHSYLLTHGDQFRGGDGMIGALGPIIRGDHKKRSRNAQIGMEYDTMVIGHWHQRIMLNRLIVNSCLKGYDEYAFTNNFPFEIPSQNLWITHPQYGITWNMPVYVDPRRKLARTPGWVSLPKGDLT